MGGRIDVRTGGWRFAAENGYDEGHAKYLHRNSLWRILKLMPTWARTTRGAHRGWLDHARAGRGALGGHVPGFGYVVGAVVETRSEGSGLGRKSFEGTKVDPVIRGLNVLGNRIDPATRAASDRAFLRFIHYEWYVPSTEDEDIYVQVFVQFRKGFASVIARLRYLLFVRWLSMGSSPAKTAGWSM